MLTFTRAISLKSGTQKTKDAIMIKTIRVIEYKENTLTLIRENGDFYIRLSNTVTSARGPQVAIIDVTYDAIMTTDHKNGGVFSIDGDLYYPRENDIFRSDEEIEKAMKNAYDDLFTHKEDEDFDKVEFDY